MSVNNVRQDKSVALDQIYRNIDLILKGNRKTEKASKKILIELLKNEVIVPKNKLLETKASLEKVNKKYAPSKLRVIVGKIVNFILNVFRAIFCLKIKAYVPYKGIVNVNNLKTKGEEPVNQDINVPAAEVDKKDPLSRQLFKQELINRARNVAKRYANGKARIPQMNKPKVFTKFELELFEKAMEREARVLAKQPSKDEQFKQELKARAHRKVNVPTQFENELAKAAKARAEVIADRPIREEAERLAAACEMGVLELAL